MKSLDPVMPASLLEKTTQGAFWAFLEKLGMHVVGFVVTMLLARFLTPTDYGTVALVAIFFAVAGVLVDGGFTSALVQKKQVTELDFNSVFYLSLGLSGLVYALLYACAPAVAGFFESPVLVPIIRVSAVTLIFNAVSSVQNAELTRQMRFRLSFHIAMVSAVVSTVVGIALAVMGYGPWALVWSSVATSFTSMVGRWWWVAWRPRWMFSFTALRPLFSFGWKMAVIFVMDALVKNLYGMMIGKLYTKADLAYFNKGQSVPDLATSTIEGTIGRVTFPALMQLQDDRERLRHAMRKMIVVSTFFVFPMMAGLAACAPSVVRIVYGDQWDAVVPYMQIFCFSVALMPLHNTNLTAITAIGRSDVFLALEIVKKALLVGTLVLVLRWGALAFALAYAFVASPLCVVINVWPNHRFFGYSLRMQLVDVFPSAVMSVVMGGMVWGVGRLFAVNTLGQHLGVAVLQVTAGVTVYAMMALLFRSRALSMVLEVLPARLQGWCPQPLAWLRRHLEKRG